MEKKENLHSGRDETPKVLIVEDEESEAQLLRRFLQDRGFTVLTAATSREALEMVEQERPQVVILDLVLPGVSGLDVLEKIRRAHPEVGVIVTSGVASEVVARNALKMGAWRYFVKPFSLKELELALRLALKSGGPGETSQT